MDSRTSRNIVRRAGAALTHHGREEIREDHFLRKGGRLAGWGERACNTVS
jgi:hypothetical protein